MESNPDRRWVEIGRRLRQLREKAKLTATQFAVKVDQSAPHIYNMENGHRPVQKHMIPAYAEALGMTAAELREALGMDAEDEEPSLAATA